MATGASKKTRLLIFFFFFFVPCLSSSTLSPLERERKAVSLLPQLSFAHGRWNQTPAIADLLSPPASFQITDVQLPAISDGKTANISAQLRLFTRLHHIPVVAIAMQGVYREQANGERALRMLGCARLANCSHPWEELGFQPGGSSVPRLEDCKLEAEIFYPSLPQTLTSGRKIRGRLTSLSAPSAPGYFDAVDLYSQLESHWTIFSSELVDSLPESYRFSSGELVATACNNPRHPERVCHSAGDAYNAGGQGSFCSMLISWAFSETLLRVMPTGKCSLYRENCTRIGPFANDRHSHSGLATSQLAIEDVKCRRITDGIRNQSANVSAVFRLITPFQHQEHLQTMRRTALDSGLTVAAEGKWNDSSGVLCMIGCRNDHDLITESNKEEFCDCRICMSAQFIFSLKERSILKGSISSVRTHSASFYPMSFQSSLDHVWSNVTYRYSKIEAVEALRERDESMGTLEQKLKTFLFKYPPSKSLHGFENDIDQRERRIRARETADSPWDSNWPRISRLREKAVEVQYFADWQLIAIEEHVRMGRPQAVDDSWKTGPSETKQGEDNRASVRVAAQLILHDAAADELRHTFFVEGQYVPKLGRMYLVGCREVEEPWKASMESNAKLPNLEGGLDCKVKMKVQYPPINAPWSSFPTVKLIVTSTRSEGDPFFFPEIRLQIKQELYMKHRKVKDFVLRLIFQTLILGCITSQVLYMRRQTEGIPYISLLMLTVQAVGYTIELLQKAVDIESVEAFMNLEVKSKVMEFLGFGVAKLLYVAALLLTVEMAKTVYLARINLRTRRAVEGWRLPAIDALGFITLIIITEISKWSAFYQRFGRGFLQQDWQPRIMQTLFLLPQIVLQKEVWKAQEMRKPLCKLFYIGITFLRMVPNAYEGRHLFFFDPYCAVFDFYKEVTHITIAAVAMVLAIVVHIQQSGLRKPSIVFSLKY